MRAVSSLCVVLVALLPAVGVFACGVGASPTDGPAATRDSDTSTMGQVATRAEDPERGHDLALLSANADAKTYKKTHKKTHKRARPRRARSARASADRVPERAAPVTITAETPATQRAVAKSAAAPSSRSKLPLEIARQLPPTPTLGLPPQLPGDPLAARPAATPRELPTARAPASAQGGGAGPVALDDDAPDSALFDREDDEEEDGEPTQDAPGERDARYQAWALPGARHRVVIARANQSGARPSCTRIVLVHPQSVEQWALLPAGWAIEHAWTTPDPAACDDRHGLPKPGDAATMDGDGRVEWAATEGEFPCELEIELMLNFPATAEQPARSVSFESPALAVEGCRVPGPLTASVAVSG